MSNPPLVIIIQYWKLFIIVNPHRHTLTMMFIRIWERLPRSRLPRRLRLKKRLQNPSKTLQNLWRQGWAMGRSGKHWTSSMKGDLSHLFTGQFDVFGFDVELSPSEQQETDMWRDMITRIDNQTKKAKQQKSGNHQQAQANDQQTIWSMDKVEGHDVHVISVSLHRRQTSQARGWRPQGQVMPMSAR